MRCTATKFAAQLDEGGWCMNSRHTSAAPAGDGAAHSAAPDAGAVHSAAPAGDGARHSAAHDVGDVIQSQNLPTEFFSLDISPHGICLERCGTTD